MHAVLRGYQAANLLMKCLCLTRGKGDQPSSASTLGGQPLTGPLQCAGGVGSPAARPAGGSRTLSTLPSVPVTPAPGRTILSPMAT